MESSEVRLRTHLGVFIGAIGLKNKPKELAKYIRKNKEFFPKIKEEHLVELETMENNTEGC
jgi:hypothetical protein